MDVVFLSRSCPFFSRPCQAGGAFPPCCSCWQVMVQSDDDALWNSLLLQVTPEENTIVAMSIIVCRDSDPIDLGISWENRKAHARMKGN